MKSKTFRQAVFPQQLTRLDFWPSLPCLPPGLLAWWKISKRYKDNRKIWQSTMNYWPMGISPHFQHPHALEAVEKATCMGQAVKKCKNMLIFFLLFLFFQIDVTPTSAGRPLNRQQAASSPQLPFNFNEKTFVNQRWVNTIGFKNRYQISISNVDQILTQKSNTVCSNGNI